MSAFLSKRQSTQAHPGCSQIACNKLLLLNLKARRWDLAAALALHLRQVAPQAAQAGMNAALLGARQMQSANKTMQSALLPPQETLDASLAAGVPEEATARPLPPLSSSSNTATPDCKRPQNGDVISLVAHMQKVCMADMQSQCVCCTLTSYVDYVVLHATTACHNCMPQVQTLAGLARAELGKHYVDIVWQSSGKSFYAAA